MIFETKTTQEVLDRYNFSFENFVSGPENQEAVNYTKQAVEDWPNGSRYPIVIQGGSGFGKTHLAIAFGREMLRKHRTHFIWIDPERYMARYHCAIDSGSLESFDKFLDNFSTYFFDDFTFLLNQTNAQRILIKKIYQLREQNKLLIFATDSSSLGSWTCRRM